MFLSAERGGVEDVRFVRRGRQVDRGEIEDPVGVGEDVDEVGLASRTHARSPRGCGGEETAAKPTRLLTLESQPVSSDAA
jgi:hypothetical protein